MIYGICYGTGPDTTILECSDLRDAYSQAVSASTECDVDVVVLSGAGPMYDSDGGMLSETHAPIRTLYTLPLVTAERIELFAREAQAYGDIDAVRLCRQALDYLCGVRTSDDALYAVADMLAESIAG